MSLDSKAIELEEALNIDSNFGYRQGRKRQADLLPIGGRHQLAVHRPGHAHPELAAVVLLRTRLRDWVAHLARDLKPAFHGPADHGKGLFRVLALAHAPG
jgi:hypothetical protein